MWQDDFSFLSLVVLKISFALSSLWPFLLHSGQFGEVEHLEPVQYLELAVVCNDLFLLISPTWNCSSRS